MPPSARRATTLTLERAEDAADELLLLIRDSFVPAFSTLENTLREKLENTEGDWE